MDEASVRLALRIREVAEEVLTKAEARKESETSTRNLLKKDFPADEAAPSSAARTCDSASGGRFSCDLNSQTLLFLTSRNRAKRYRSGFGDPAALRTARPPVRL